MKAFLFLLVISVCYGCTVVDAVKAPAGTSASYNLRSKIAATISAQQKLYDKACKSFTITDARVAGSQDLIILEEWSVLACGNVTTYDVQIIHTPYGGITYNVTRRE